jgi:hypothetical protein
LPRFRRFSRPPVSFHRSSKFGSLTLSFETTSIPITGNLNQSEKRAEIKGFNRRCEQPKRLSATITCRHSGAPGRYFDIFERFVLCGSIIKRFVAADPKRELDLQEKTSETMIQIAMIQLMLRRLQSL